MLYEKRISKYDLPTSKMVLPIIKDVAAAMHNVVDGRHWVTVHFSMYTNSTTVAGIRKAQLRIYAACADVATPQQLVDKAMQTFRAIALPLLPANAVVFYTNNYGWRYKVRNNCVSVYYRSCGH